MTASLQRWLDETEKQRPWNAVGGLAGGVARDGYLTESCIATWEPNIAKGGDACKPRL